MLDWIYYRDPKLKYKVAVIIVLILLVSSVICGAVYRSSTELRGNVRYNKIYTTSEEYKQMKKAMDSYVSSAIYNNSYKPDVAVAPTIISDDTYTYFSTSKEDITIGAKTSREGEVSNKLKLDYSVLFENALLGVYINEAGVLRAVIADNYNGDMSVGYSDSTISIKRDKGPVIGLGNSENKYNKDLRQLVKLELTASGSEEHMQKYFTQEGGEEFKYIIKHIKNSLYNNEYGIAVKFGKSKEGLIGKDRIYICIYNIGVDKGIVDIILKLDRDNKIFDIDIL